MVGITKQTLSPRRFKEKFKQLIDSLLGDIRRNHNLNLEFDELGDLLLSVCRYSYLVHTFEACKDSKFCGEYFQVLTKSERNKRKYSLNIEEINRWIKEWLVPNTIIMGLDDEDVIRLLIFSFQITYSMFMGGTKATVSQKGFRERRRTFEAILVDQFIGKLGEIMLKRFIEKKFPNYKIELDWEISTDIERYRNDIINSKKRVSIKTSSSLAGIWAEADKGYDYGIMVKCSVPQPTILQFFVETCGFSKLLKFADEKIPSHNGLFKDYISDLKWKLKDYVCGDIKTHLKGFICGYFKLSDYEIMKKGKNLPFLGEVREDRYIVPIGSLKYTESDWKRFLTEAEIQQSS